MKRFLTLFIAALSSFCAAHAQLQYHDASALPLYGKITDATENRYTRLPDSLENITRPPVWKLSRNSAGLSIRFSSNSTTIAARWTNLYNNRMDHMTDIGVKGLDLYILDGGQWRFANSARPSFEKESEATLMTNMAAAEREYMLFLPLYDGLSALEIGVDSSAHISLPRIDTPERRNPIVFYGTSILQGGCANRPGMAFTNIIARRLNRETVNLGFSGNALLDFEIAEVMAAADAGCYVLDFVPNASKDQILGKMETFYRIIRDKHPGTPIIFVEDPVFPISRFNLRIAGEIIAKNEALHTVFDDLVRQGESDIYLVSSRDMLGGDGEATVDGIHFTDLGMIRYADLLCPVIERYLAE